MDEITPSSGDPAETRWIVEFTEFRVRDEHQRRVIEELGQMAHAVVRVWLHVATPTAIVHGTSGKPIRRVSFMSRSQMRRFVGVFGGRHVRPE
jgi:hypothetical protein